MGVEGKNKPLLTTKKLQQNSIFISLPRKFFVMQVDTWNAVGCNRCKVKLELQVEKAAYF